MDVDKVRLKNITIVDAPRNTKLPYASNMTLKAVIVDPKAVGIEPMAKTLDEFGLAHFYNVHPYKQNGNEITVEIQIERRAPTEWTRTLNLKKKQ